ncbi:serine O-acetyltransferase, partial [Vibrio parahaemolyticus]
KIADNIKIGANAVVNKSFFESDKTLVGVPARAL